MGKAFTLYLRSSTLPPLAINVLRKASWLAEILIQTSTTASPEIETRAKYTVSGESTLLKRDAPAPIMLKIMAKTGVPLAVKRENEAEICP